MGKKIIRCSTCNREFAQWVSRIKYGRTYCQPCIDACLKLPPLTLEIPQGPVTTNFKYLPLGTAASLAQMDREIRQYFESKND